MPAERDAREPVPRAKDSAPSSRPWVPDIALTRNSGMTIPYAANFRSLMASKSCTPPPTRLVV